MQENYPTTNLVICCWSGPRRFYDNRAKTNPAYYLQKQFERLQKLSHNLTQITIAVSQNTKEPKSFRDYLKTFPKKIKDSQIEIIDRPNLGMSYGAISDIYVKYKNKFDYYFQLEDDYLLGQDNFDSIHINFLKNTPDADWFVPLLEHILI